MKTFTFIEKHHCSRPEDSLKWFSHFLLTSVLMGLEFFFPNMSSPQPCHYGFSHTLQPFFPLEQKEANVLFQIIWQSGTLYFLLRLRRSPEVIAKETAHVKTCSTDTCYQSMYISEQVLGALRCKSINFRQCCL